MFSVKKAIILVFSGCLLSRRQYIYVDLTLDPSPVWRGIKFRRGEFGSPEVGELATEGCLRGQV